uniref:Uncharacterized protein n=1 Tax=Caenorhabditis tropicalis TaxID=1561998 RepID=A0A1I7TCE9_9PELO
MKRLFDFTIIKTLWAARLQSLFESIFGKASAAKSIENPVQTITQTTITPKPSTSSSAPIKREMHSSAAVKTAFRKPMIKFVGARLPRPFFDAKSLPPLQVSGNFSAPVTSSASSTTSPATASSIGPVGKIPRGQGIEWNQLPQRYQRQGMSEEECEAVNTGFFYRG